MISRQNNFDIIRLLAAFQVMLGHGMHHLKISDNNVLFQLFSYFPGVLIFFTVSGYLIFASFDQNPDLKRYTVNRALRIFPALWICLAVTVLLLISFSGLQIQIGRAHV